MKKEHIYTGILAHVDAGKTTLSEAMLYISGKIRKLGRVDNKDAYLDTYEIEKQRGITIFSKQAEFSIGDLDVTLLDSPGHMDFSAEMERILQVLDYAILVISAADKVQSHTRTLYKLLKRYNIPAFVFINKMDQYPIEKDELIQELSIELGGNFVDFTADDTESFFEDIAMCDEKALESFLENNTVSTKQIQKLIKNRKVFPCCFGSALKLDKVEDFMNIFRKYVLIPQYGQEFGAKIFKISRDENGNRLTHMKVVGGSIKTKDTVFGYDNDEKWEEKINQIRIYSGEKYETPNEVHAGEICAVTGLTKTKALEGIGCYESIFAPMIEPVLTYKVILPNEIDAKQMLPKLKQLEEEQPELHIAWNEKLKEIQVQIMGEIQTEILQSIIKKRFDIDVEFGEGNIVYKETIENTVEGVGHFEPLRHYAEVHLKLEPQERGSKITVASECSEDMLDKNWQRLIMTHILEKEHIGVMTGSSITDIKFTIVAGKAHQKHTEGGDFRQATYRAVRQGLMQAKSVLLEPFYEFVLEIPAECIGRAMTDIERMYGKLNPPENKGDRAVLRGTAPVSEMRSYYKEVLSYTKGLGRLSCNFAGYDRCHNESEVVSRIGYNALQDLDNPSCSVFCANGAGFNVPYDEVFNYMHIESMLHSDSDKVNEEESVINGRYEEKWLDIDEIDSILNRATNANAGTKKKNNSYSKAKRIATEMQRTAYNISKQKVKLDKYILVDGYNVIFSWQKLNELAKINIDSARESLMEILCNYQGAKGDNLIIVFDAYKTESAEKFFDYKNIHIVYTKKAETADAYIEKFAHENAKKYDITVITSDGLEQIIIRGAGAKLISSREFEEEVKRTNESVKEIVNNNAEGTKSYLLDGFNIDLDKKI